jgi:hypothetical protein
MASAGIAAASAETLSALVIGREVPAWCISMTGMGILENIRSESVHTRLSSWQASATEKSPSMRP